MSKQLIAKSLLRNIQRDYQRYHELVSLLEQQRRLIIQRRADALTLLNQQIEQQYVQLIDSTAERADLLTKLHLPANASGIERFVKALPTSMSHKAQALWQHLHQHALTCKQLNEQNSVLLHQQQAFIKQLLGQQQDDIYYEC